MKKTVLIFCVIGYISIVQARSNFYQDQAFCEEVAKGPTYDAINKGLAKQSDYQKLLEKNLKKCMCSRGYTEQCVGGK
jgi:hypothetical protein